MAAKAVLSVEARAASKAASREGCVAEWKEALRASKRIPASRAASKAASRAGRMVEWKEAVRAGLKAASREGRMAEEMVAVTVEMARSVAATMVERGTELEAGTAECCCSRYPSPALACRWVSLRCR